MSKTAKVLNCQYTSPWTSPQGKQLHYHAIEFDNGDAGNVAVLLKNDPRIQPGKEVEYEITGNKIKIISSATNNQQAPAQSRRAGGGGYSKKDDPKEYLSYICGYSQQLVVAGKTTNKDIAAWKTLVRAMYAEVKELLAEENK